MEKVFMQNLGMLVTDICNLNCGHCLRGASLHRKMSKEVIERTLDQLVAIGNLCLCGGEPTYALDVLENIFSYLVDSGILVNQVSMTINGTNYSEEFLRLLDYIDDYIPNNQTIFTISYDIYHQQELEKLNMLATYIENVKKYSESKYFYGLQRLNKDLKLFREGNAEELNSKLTVDLKPIDIVVTYVGKRSKFDKNGLCNIGPLMSVNTEGIITEENASIEHQHTLYNYGNVFHNTFEEVALERGRIIKPRQWNKETGKILRKYATYNK